MVNIFDHYEQDENRHTNALFAVFRASQFIDATFVRSFLREEVGIDPLRPIDSCMVLSGMDGTADGELSNAHCRIRFETKIVSGTLRKEQIDAHLQTLGAHAEQTKKLVLLTPDDSGSNYVQQFVSGQPQNIRHISWRRLFDRLSAYITAREPSVFSDLIGQFLEYIRETVFESDFAGVILKVDFGDRSEVYEDSYLTKFASGEWDRWNTPKCYEKLDGTGRKLLLYDRTRAGITIEVEITRVQQTNEEEDFPWSNLFAPGTLRIFQPPIPTTTIRTIFGFEQFGVHRKDRSAIRNLTHEQYRKLVSAVSAATLSSATDAAAKSFSSCRYAKRDFSL